jgi:hypothetical protein
MNLRNLALIVVLTIGSAAGLREATPTPQRDSVQPNCVLTVPPGWGEFKGGSRFGLAFEDSAGTLRFINDVGCQIAGTQPVPVVSLEVRRK